MFLNAIYAWAIYVWVAAHFLVDFYGWFLAQAAEAIISLSFLFLPLNNNNYVWDAAHF